MKLYRSFQLCLFISFFTLPVLSQKSYDLTMVYPPGSGIFRNYSVYEPTGFNPNKTNKLLVGFHPYSIGIWNANTWRDTLRSFIDLVNVLLVCPDGGSNGRIDDQADYDFTKALIDTIRKQYMIDPLKIHLIGFSVGGKAVYEYGLNHDKEIKGMIPIGAAIDGVDFSAVIHKAKCNSFYLIHGEKDSPNTRYSSMKDDLKNNNGLVDGILMANIGHTINFPSRNTILKMAFTFVDTSDCDFTAVSGNIEKPFVIYPGIVDQGDNIYIRFDRTWASQIRVYHYSGEKIYESVMEYPNRETVELNTINWPKGISLFVIESGTHVYSVKVMLK